MKVVVNGTNITKYINETSYKVNSAGEYEEWLDGNYTKHRIYSRDRITGSFTLALYGQDEMTTAKFLEIWNGAVVNNVVTIQVYVENKATNQLINAYYTMNIDSHRKLSNGEYLDMISIELEER